MKFSPIGEIAQKYWEEIPRHFNHVKLDRFVIMPDHVHGILILKNKNHESGVQNFEPHDSDNEPRHDSDNEPRHDSDNEPRHDSDNEPRHDSDNEPRHDSYNESPQNQNFETLEGIHDYKIHRYQHIIPGSVGSIMRAYKSVVTHWCRKNGFKNFGWQRNYHERIIKTQSELDRIRQYIINNPAKWESKNIQ
jgi:REP element-mobilizing transposase RayT